MESFLKEIDRLLAARSVGRMTRDAVCLVARSCLKGLQIQEGEGEGECRIGVAHLGKRDAVMLRFVPKQAMKHLIDRWEKQWDILRFHHLHQIADKVVLSDQAEPALNVYFYL